MILRILISLLRLPVRFRRKRKQTPIRSLVIVELTRLGDVLAILPAVRLLAKHYSQARVRVVVDLQYSSLLRAMNLPFDVYGIERPGTTVGFLRAVRLVRGFKADLALSMSPPKRNTAVTLLSGARCKVGYLTYHDSVAPYLETTPIEAVGCGVSKQEVYGRDHIEERSLKICRALGVETRNVVRALQIESSVHTAVRTKLVEMGVLRTRPCVVLHPFSGWKFRSWPLERFAEVTNVLLRCAPDYDIVLVCEKTEETRLAPVAERCHDSQRVRVFASEDLLMSAVLLREAVLVVGNDSGPLHLAAALGTPVVGLFGPASPELTAPRSDRGVFHYRKVECSPCDQRVCVQPSKWCMSLISVDAVVQSIVMQLSLPSVVEAAANAEG